MLIRKSKNIKRPIKKIPNHKVKTALCNIQQGGTKEGSKTYLEKFRFCFVKPIKQENNSQF